MALRPDGRMRSLTAIPPLRAAFSLMTPSTPRVMELRQDDDAFAFWDYGPELSRRFRALKVWMILKGAGTTALSEAIENNIGCARHLQELVQSSDDFEMLAPVELSIFCFRYRPSLVREASRDSDEKLNQFNERLLVALQRRKFSTSRTH